jgi:hypothetical protein
MPVLQQNSGASGAALIAANITMLYTVPPLEFLLQDVEDVHSSNLAECADCVDLQDQA